MSVVLLSNGWDRGHREAAAETFDLGLNDFQDRHEMVVDLLETGRMTLDEYLITTIFHRNRPFSREAHITFMKAGPSRCRSRSIFVTSGPTNITCALARVLLAAARRAPGSNSPSLGAPGASKRPPSDRHLFHRHHLGHVLRA